MHNKESVGVFGPCYGSRTAFSKVFECHVMGHSNSLGVIGDSSKLPNTESPIVLKRRKASKLGTQTSHNSSHMLPIALSV